MDYKESLNLPKTDFPMKANLSKREPEMLARWDGMRIYEMIRETSQGRKPYILHDGPPYANGNIHLGTALNKIIKDILIKAKNMSGRDSVYVPGWDCHGLPIEHQVDKELGEKKAGMSQADKRRFCRVYADKYRRDPARAVQASRGLRRVGESLSHDDLRLRGDHRRGVREALPERERLQGEEARLLVRLLQDGPGRGRGGIPGPHDAVDLRQVPPAFPISPRVCRSSPARRSPSSSGRRPPGRFRRTWPSPSTRSSSTWR